ncbi:MAG TPA: NAD(P)-binding domain-containing protein [Candidatus Dormibacteraeota bacterium]
MTGHWAIAATAREADAGTRDAVARSIRSWLSGGGDGVALITCHRAELYGYGDPPVTDASTRLLPAAQATDHLLRVACGLESVIVGEDEVLHQVREAMRSATGNARLHRLFQTAVATGRAARSGRSESSGNLAQSAVRWLSTKADFADRTVIVAGAGRMGATLAHSLTRAGARVVVSSRNADRAAGLARLYGASGVSLRAGADLVTSAAAVAIALGGPWMDLQGLAGKNLPPIADISAPPAVPDSVRRGLNGNFLGIDDLYRRTQPLPGAYIKDAERLVAASSAAYTAWLERAR